MTENLAGNTVSDSIGLSILLIDHDTASITSLTSMLKQFSYKVIVMTVDMASKVVPMIEKHKDIGLIIVNIETHHIDSHSFLNDLLHKDIPLILINPETNTKETSDILTKRACFYLKKPISENDIKNMWDHVVHTRRQELEKTSKAINQEDVVEERIKQIDAFRENIKRQRSFTTSETNRKRINIANDELKNKHIEIENKRDEETKFVINFGRRCNLWTHERHMKFLAAISILGDEDSRPKSILRIMNDTNLTLRQVSSHLQKYKSQVERINNTLPSCEWRSTDTTFEYPLDYEYPFKASNLTKNLIACNSSWYSLRKKKTSSSSSSSIAQYSFKKPACEPLKFHLGGMLDLTNHSFLGNLLNKSSMKVNHVPSDTSNNPTCNIPSTNNDVNHIGLVSTGLSSENPPPLSGLPSNVGASNTDKGHIGSSSVLETNRNQLDPNPISIPDSYVPQDNQCSMGASCFLPDYTMNPLETNMDRMGCVPSTENYGHHHETNMNQMDRIHSLDNYVLPETDMNIVAPETNTNQMGWAPSTENCGNLGTNMNQMDWIHPLDSYVLPETDMNTNQVDWVSSGEGYVPSENIIPSEVNINQMDRVSSGENQVLSQDMIFNETNANHLGFVSGERSYEIPHETNTNQMDWFHSEESYRLLENMTSSETNTTQMGLVPCETSYAALENVIPLETNMEEMGFVPYEIGNDIPIEDLICFDTDVDDMDIDTWLENYGSSETNLPISTSYIGHESALNTPMDSIRANDHSLPMHFESTSQQHTMMDSRGYQNIEATNQRDAMERGDPHCMDWLGEILKEKA